jgi:hypothetical protein
MGTSVNQASPRTTSWRSVATCYQSDQISPDRAATEVWRAATATAGTLDAQIKSDGVFACYQLAQRGVAPQQIHTALTEISERHGNSIVLEFAKRATLIAAHTPKPAEHWPQQFFKQVSAYLVARDASGFVGPNCRSKTVGDLMSLKAAIGETVAEKVSGLRIAARSPQEWSRVASATLSALAGRRR